MADLPTIERHRGDTYANVLTFKNADGTALNLTGYTLVLTVDRRREPSDGTTQLFQLTGTLTDAPNGKASFTPTLMQAGATPGTYYYDVQLTDGSGAIKTAGPGKYVFKQDITK
jgi:hypothetical protein